MLKGFAKSPACLGLVGKPECRRQRRSEGSAVERRVLVHEVGQFPIALIVRPGSVRKWSGLARFYDQVVETPVGAKRRENSSLRRGHTPRTIRSYSSAVIAPSSTISISTALACFMMFSKPDRPSSSPAFLLALQRMYVINRYQLDLNSTELPGIVAQSSRYFPHVLQIVRAAAPRAVFQLTDKEFSPIRDLRLINKMTLS